MLDSKVYDILDNKVDTMIKEYYSLENKRIQKYPVSNLLYIFKRKKITEPFCSVSTDALTL
jgi:hypothetical protein